MRPRRTRWAKLARQIAIVADPSRPRPDRARAARVAASLAEQLGLLARPNRCSWCQRRKLLERHHDDHSQPLCVIFLCRDCHGIADGMCLCDGA
jgi:hypothetical protein